MAKELPSGTNHAAVKSPPKPSPLRKANYDETLCLHFHANMRILVTGVAGFIVYHLVDKLMENEKNEVIVVDNYFTGSKDNLKQWIGHPRFELIRMLMITSSSISRFSHLDYKYVRYDFLTVLRRPWKLNIRLR